MSLRNPFAIHYQNVWEERGRSGALPAWQRVAALAYARHGANLHAPFSPGELAHLLGNASDVAYGGKTMARQNVFRAIRTAVDRGWLAEGSNARCLIVP